MAVSLSAAALPLRGILHALANRTVLFRLGDYIFVTFGLFGALGAFLGGLWTAAVLLGAGLPLLDVGILSAAIIVGHVVMARAFLLLWRLPGLLNRPVHTLRTVEFATWGGFIAIAVGLITYSLVSGRSLLGLIDAAALGGGLGHAVGRIGCLSFGCCFGRPTDSPLAIRYDSADAKAVRTAGLRGVPIHPTPLYEAAFDLSLFVLLNIVALSGSREGVPAALYLALYGSARFLLEFLRYNSADDHIGPLPRNQWLSLTQAFAGVVLLLALAASSGPASPSIADANGEVVALVPLLAASAVFVFLAYSLHRGSIGRW